MPVAGLQSNVDEVEVGVEAEVEGAGEVEGVEVGEGEEVEVDGDEGARTSRERGQDTKGTFGVECGSELLFAIGVSFAQTVSRQHVAGTPSPPEIGTSFGLDFSSLLSFILISLSAFPHCAGLLTE